MAEKYVSVGGFKCFPLMDGSLVYPKELLFPGPLEKDAADALAPEPLPKEFVVSYSGLLVDTGKKRVLIDTGAGTMSPDTGHLAANLKERGYSPEQIDFVILSHMHPDHIGGLMTENGNLRYPNAQVVASQPEYEFWTSEATQSKLKAQSLCGLGNLELAIQAAIEKNIIPLAKKGALHLVEEGATSQPCTGVTTVPAGGHTPGHIAIWIDAGREQLLFAGDSILHPLQVRYPAWKTAFDVQPEQSALTRLKVLDRCATEDAMTFHFHFPFPCLGRIARWSGGYKWEPKSL
jgi:glyoxylase-like metal-dependent hydrolase (beta-lactamase superfamily II)